MKKSIVIQKLHVMLARKATRDGKIRRADLISIIGQRMGRLEPNEKKVIITELKDAGVILAEDASHYSISMVL